MSLGPSTGDSVDCTAHLRMALSEGGFHGLAERLEWACIVNGASIGRLDKEGNVLDVAITAGRWISMTFRGAAWVSTEEHAALERAQELVLEAFEYQEQRR